MVAPKVSTVFRYSSTRFDKSLACHVRIHPKTTKFHDLNVRVLQQNIHTVGTIWTTRFMKSDLMIDLPDLIGHTFDISGLIHPQMLSENVYQSKGYIMAVRGTSSCRKRCVMHAVSVRIYKTLMNACWILVFSSVLSRICVYARKSVQCTQLISKSLLSTAFGR